MNRRFRVAFALTVLAVFCAIVPIGIGYLFTPPHDALYRVPGLECTCGYAEYIAFDKDRLYWWNIGHNNKNEARQLVPTNQEERFELLNYDQMPSGSVEFFRHHIRLQLDEKPAVDIPREWNTYRVWLAHFMGRKEAPSFQSLEDIKKRITENMAQRSGPPNSHAFGTFGTSAAEQPLVPKAGGSR